MLLANYNSAGLVFLVDSLSAVLCLNAIIHSGCVVDSEAVKENIV